MELIIKTIETIKPFTFGDRVIFQEYVRNQIKDGDFNEEQLEKLEDYLGVEFLIEDFLNLKNDDEYKNYINNMFYGERKYIENVMDIFKEVIKDEFIKNNLIENMSKDKDKYIKLLKKDEDKYKNIISNICKGNTKYIVNEKEIYEKYRKDFNKKIENI